MSVARSQRFVYFQNKANHYHKLRNIKSTVDHYSPRTHIPKPKVYRPIPLLRQHQIEVENEKLISRLINIAKSDKAQVEAEGTYSRYNKIERPFRSLHRYDQQAKRAITISNSEMKNRLSSVKPAIGTNNQWHREYFKSLCCKRNLSKYLENNKSKAELHISTQLFVPQHLRDYGLTEDLNNSLTGKQATVPTEKLFVLPQIERKGRGFSWNFNEISKTNLQVDL